MSRTLNVVRLHLLIKRTFVWWPLIVLIGTLALSALVWWLIPSEPGLPMVVGAAGGPISYVLVVGILAVTHTFPFSQALSVTRREFHLGTTIMAMLLAAGLAVVYLLGGLVERATDGWGLDGLYFGVPFLWADGAAAAGVAVFACTVLAFVLGYWNATLYRRSGMTGTLMASLLVVTSIVIGVVVMTRTGSWPGLLAQLGSWGTWGLAWIAGALAVLVSTGSYLLLRRAQP